MSESPETRARRLLMRSWRRGTKEMDLILGPFAEARLAAMTDVDLAAYEALLAESDPDLLAWITGARPAPAPHAALVAGLLAFARARHDDGTATGSRAP